MDMVLDVLIIDYRYSQPLVVIIPIVEFGSDDKRRKFVDDWLVMNYKKIMY